MIISDDFNFDYIRGEYINENGGYYPKKEKG